MISFIVPAHNEQACLGPTLQAINSSARALGCAYEIIVADDASADITAEIARQNGATVVSVTHRQIAATRNSGARSATGDRFFFVDADTIVNPRTIQSALHAMDRGAVGGGAATGVARAEQIPLYARLLLFSLAFAPKLVGFTGGAFMFCTRDAFYATGGFNERMFWAEEGVFALALKRQGRFFVPWEPILTSGRRFRKISGLQLLGGAIQILLSPIKGFTRRSSVEKVWYDSNRADDDKLPNSLSVRISNGIALVIVVLLVTGPIWDFIPWRLTPVASPLGKFRFLIGVFLCHLGALGWIPGLLLLVNVLRQKRPTGLLQSAGLIAFCFWQAWDSSWGVVRIWTQLIQFAHRP